MTTLCLGSLLLRHAHLFWHVLLDVLERRQMRRLRMWDARIWLDSPQAGAARTEEDQRGVCGRDNPGRSVSSDVDHPRSP